MPRFVNHDGLAEGLLNLGFCSSAVGPHASWKSQLQNTHDTLSFMLHRMESDWVSLTPKMRKPWGMKDLATKKKLWCTSFGLFFIVWCCALVNLKTGTCAPSEAQLQKVCALFVACIDQFKAQAPSAFSESALAEVNKALLNIRWLAIHRTT